MWFVFMELALFSLLGLLLLVLEMLPVNRAFEERLICGDFMWLELGVRCRLI